jgi:hypothetical protein
LTIFDNAGRWKWCRADSDGNDPTFGRRGFESAEEALADLEDELGETLTHEQVWTWQTYGG